MSMIYKFSYKLLFTIGLLDIFTNLVLPRLSLLIWVAILMLADLVTGLLKATLLKEKITSDKLRHSIIKFLQYFGSIGLIVVLANQNQDSPNFVMVSAWARDGVTILIIYIECLSVFENLYAMDKKTPFAIYVIQPIYWLLSLAVRKNPFQQAQDAKKNPKGPDEEARDKDEDREEPDTFTPKRV